MGPGEAARAAGRPAPLIALYHPDAARTAQLAAAVAADGYRVRQLPPPETGLPA